MKAQNWLGNVDCLWCICFLQRAVEPRLATNKAPLAAICYCEFSEKLLYCVEHGYREQSSV